MSECEFCERDFCDTDCAFADRHGRITARGLDGPKEPRRTAAEHRADGAMAVCRLVGDAMETLLGHSWSPTPEAVRDEMVRLHTELRSLQQARDISMRELDVAYEEARAEAAKCPSIVDEMRSTIAGLTGECDGLRSELGALSITDSDRAALATAAFELKERRSNYHAMLMRCSTATDPFVVEAYTDAIAAVEAAIEVVERMAKR